MKLPLLASAQAGRAAEFNFSARAAWAARRLPGMRVLDDHGLLLVDSGLNWASFNVVCRARLEPLEARARAWSVRQHFTREGRPFVWWLGPHDEPASLGQVLARTGLERGESWRALALDLESLPAPGPSGDVELRCVSAREELHAFVAVLAQQQPDGAELLHEYYERAAAVLLHPEAPVRFYLAFLRAHVVAACECWRTDVWAGLYSLGTLPDHRRRGYATLIARHALVQARAAGARAAWAQATGAAEPMLRRLGFEPYGAMVAYGLPASGAPV